MAKKKKSQQQSPVIGTKSIYEMIPENYVDYGKAVNVSRSFPYELDGLKPVYRRILYTLYQMGGTMHKTSTVQGEVMKIHPHNPDHQVDPISHMTQYGLLSTRSNQGSFALINGHEPPAAPRYTNTWLNDKFREIIKYAMSEVTLIPTDTGYKEPESIPFPVPLTLMMDKVKSIGVGIGCQFPTFSMESMMDAYYNDNHLKLKYRGNVNINYKESDLKKLWTTGEGRVTYYPNIDVRGKSVFVECTPGLIELNFSRASKDPDVITFLQHQDAGRIFVNDLSDKTHEGLVEIGITKNTRAVDIDWLLETVTKVAKSKTMYQLYVSTGEFLHKVSLKEWIDKCYKNYIDLTNKGIQSKINKLKWDRKVYESIPLIAKELLNNNSLSNEDLSKRTKLDIAIVSDVMGRSISMIRKTDHTSRINSIDKQISELQSIDPDKIIQQNYI